MSSVRENSNGGASGALTFFWVRLLWSWLRRDAAESDGLFIGEHRWRHLRRFAFFITGRGADVWVGNCYGTREANGLDIAAESR